MVGSEGRRGVRPGAGARPGGAFSHPAPRLPPPLRPESRREVGNNMEQGDVWDSARRERGRHQQESRAQREEKKGATEQQVAMKRGNREK